MCSNTNRPLLILFCIACTPLTLWAAPQGEREAVTLCDPILRPEFVDGEPVDKEAPARLLAGDKPVMVRLQASTVTSYSSGKTYTQYEIRLEDDVIGAIRVDDAGCLVDELYSITAIRNRFWLQAFVDEGIGALLNRYHDHKVHSVVHWGKFEKYHHEIATGVDSDNFKAIAATVKQYMMAREDLEPRTFEFFRNIDEKESFGLTDGTKYYSCHANERESKQSHGRIRRKHFFRLTKDGTLTHIIEPQSNIYSANELKVAGLIAYLTALGEDPRAAFPVFHFTIRGKAYDQGVYYVDVDYYQTRDGRFFVKEDFSLGYRYEQAENAGSVLLEWARRCAAMEARLFPAAMTLMDAYDETELLYTSDRIVDSSVGVAERRRFGQYSVNRITGKTTCEKLYDYFKLPDTPDSGNDVMPEEFFASLPDVALTPGAELHYNDRFIPEDSRALVGGWITTALEHLQDYGAGENLISWKGDQQVLEGKSVVITPVLALDRRVSTIGGLGSEIVNAIMNPENPLFGTTVLTDPRSASTATAFIFIVIDWVLWNRNETEKSAHRAESDLTAVLAHEIFGVLPPFLETPIKDLHKIIAPSKQAERERNAFDIGIAFQTEIINSDAFGSWSPERRRAFLETRDLHRDLRATWK